MIIDDCVTVGPNMWGKDGKICKQFAGSFVALYRRLLCPNVRKRIFYPSIVKWLSLYPETPPSAAAMCCAIFVRGVWCASLLPARSTTRTYLTNFAQVYSGICSVVLELWQKVAPYKHTRAELALRAHPKLPSSIHLGTVDPVAQIVVPGMPDPSSRIIHARVVKAYTKRAPNELSLLVGDNLTVLDATNASMWYGHLSPRSPRSGAADKGLMSNLAEPETGWFPAANCVPVGAPPMPSHPSNTNSKGGIRLSMRLDSSTFRNQLTAALGDPGIIVGTSIPGVPSPRLRKHARALHDYAAEASNELALKAGDIVSLLDSTESESWWEGESQSGAVGFFPKDFVQVFRDPSAVSFDPSLLSTTTLDYSEFEDPHALAIIAQVVTSHEPVVPVNDSGLPFLPLQEGAVVALLDSNPNHMYWLVVHFNNNHAPLNHTTGTELHPPPTSKPSSARIGLVPKSCLAVFEGLAEPQCNYPFLPVTLGITRRLANRAVGSVQACDGQPACLARIAFEFVGEQENEHEYLGVGDLVWVIDDDEAIKTEAWVEVEMNTRRAFCPSTFVDVLSDRVQAPKPGMIVDFDFSATYAERMMQQEEQRQQQQKMSHPAPLTPLPPTPPEGSPPTSVTIDKPEETADSTGKRKKKRDKGKSPSFLASKDSHTGPTSTSSATIARALYEYKAESNSELTLHVGDLIRLTDYPPSEEWWEGTLLAADGSALPEDYIGFFPRDFVVILANPNPTKKKKRPKRGASGRSKSSKSKLTGTNSDLENASAESSDGKSTKKSSTLEDGVSALTTQVESLSMDLEMRQAELSTKEAEVDMVRMELDAKVVECELQAAEIKAMSKEMSALKSSYAELESLYKRSAEHMGKVKQQQMEAEALHAEVAKWKARAEASESKEAQLSTQVAHLTKKLEETHLQAFEKAKNHRDQTQAAALAVAPPARPTPPPREEAPSALRPTHPSEHSSSSSTTPHVSTPPAATPKARALPPTPTTTSHTKIAEAPKRSLPPSQPAPSLPPEFVKKTAAPTSGIQAASTISAQSSAAVTKKTAATRDSHAPVKATVAPSASSPTPKAAPTTAPKQTSSATQPPPKVLDEFEAKRRFFESLK